MPSALGLGAIKETDWSTVDPLWGKRYRENSTERAKEFLQVSVSADHLQSADCGLQSVGCGPIWGSSFGKPTRGQKEKPPATDAD